jgi:hypothetical protein
MPRNIRTDGMKAVGESGRKVGGIQMPLREGNLQYGDSSASFTPPILSHIKAQRPMGVSQAVYFCLWE